MAIEFYNVFEYAIVRDQLIANTVLVALSTVAIALRFLSRRIRRSKLWWDDVCIVASMLNTYGMLAMHYHYARVGMRHHITDIPMDNTILIFKMLIVYQIVYYNCMVFAKVSYLFFYLHIFVTPGFRMAARVCMGCAGAYWVGSMLQIFLICQPFAKNWDSTLPGHCASMNVAFSTIGAFNLITDILIMALPVHHIWKLQMSSATKVALYCIFGLGFFISAITIIRIHVLTTVNFSDLPYSMIWAAFWSVAEPALAITNACVPMMRPVFKAAFPGIFSSAKPTYSSQAGAQSGASGSAFKRVRDTESEMPLTQLEPSKSGSRGQEYEASLNDRSHDGGSTHMPRSVIGESDR
ncbi:integral membrane protein [Aspergillus ellipticus CBS 707.79]|uniref:Integral membrane protein n=1 Tax=Aspergillus ellipticus CBS 707.79 TaxID=1448320 RepID=A0A319E1B4_9EURO|nr:integral membrane protein [Aspergillus ellipticus CBS 707.79]